MKTGPSIDDWHSPQLDSDERVNCGVGLPSEENVARDCERASNRGVDTPVST
eukprot:CAMPEP_0183333934 /NCGR_PEP_ID=MMETSP0164_2-20130417/2684_1 /TAXON_ID=221442 /ORGANISM="Coccolithus pelagicus ssp braarudi, Strain PLY182g" /LENGTH=51 /DNA_ID=CAMNT_0025502965 /DNA_START=584 /DNA_END=739 /DNA_ORIENTATION=+